MQTPTPTCQHCRQKQLHVQETRCAPDLTSGLVTSQDTDDIHTYEHTCTYCIARIVLLIGRYFQKIKLAYILDHWLGHVANS